VTNGRTGDLDALRRANEARLVDALRLRGGAASAGERGTGWRSGRFPGLTRDELAQAAGMSRPSVVKFEERFGEVLRVERGDGPARIALRDEPFVAVGLDVSTGHVRGRVADAHGHLMPVGPKEFERGFAEPPGPDDVLDWAVDAIPELLRRAGAEWDDVIGIGISVAAPLHRDTGEIDQFTLIEEGWRERSLAEELVARISGRCGARSTTTRASAGWPSTRTARAAAATTRSRSNGPTASGWGCTSVASSTTAHAGSPASSGPRRRG
jgi:hypothetical protein